MAEHVVGTAKPYKTGKPDSLVVVIPKEVRDRLGNKSEKRMIVKVDHKGRIIYEPMKSEFEESSEDVVKNE